MAVVVVAAAASASAMIGLQAMTAGEDMAAAASVVVAILGAAALTAEVEEVVALATVGAEVVVVQLGWIRRPCTRCTSRCPFACAPRRVGQRLHLCICHGLSQVS